MLSKNLIAALVLFMSLAWTANEAAAYSGRLLAGSAIEDFFSPFMLKKDAKAKQDNSREAAAQYEKELIPRRLMSGAYAHYIMGLLYENEGNYKSALGEYKKCAAIEDTPDVYIKMGSAHLAMGDAEKAKEELGVAVARAPQDARSRLMLALLYLSTNKLEDATKQYEEVLKNDPHQLEAMVSLADLYVSQSKTEEAIKVYKDIIAEKPEFAYAYFNLGMLCLKLKRADEAEEAFSKAVSLNPDYLEAHLGLAAVYDIKADKDKAAAEYKRALDIEPTDKEVYRRLGEIYYETSLYDNSITQYNIVLKLDPKDTGAYLGIAQNYIYKKSYLEAASTLSKALELGADMPQIYIMLGYSYDQGGDLNGALLWYKKAVERDPKNAIAHFYVASVLERSGERAKAIEELKASIAINDSMPEVLNYLGYMYAEKGENLDEAISIIKKAINSEPDNGAYIDSLGWAYFKKGLVDEAQSELERAVTLEQDPVIHDHLGDVYNKKGMRDKAVAQWNKALELDPKEEKIKVKKKIAEIKK